MMNVRLLIPHAQLERKMELLPLDVWPKEYVAHIQLKNSAKQTLVMVYVFGTQTPIYQHLLVKISPVLALQFLLQLIMIVMYTIILKR